MTAIASDTVSADGSIETGKSSWDRTCGEAMARKPGLTESPYEEQILQEQVRQLYSLAPLGLVATALNSLLVFFVMKDVLPYRVIVTWLVAISIITIVRGALLVWFRRKGLEPATVSNWRNGFLAGLSLTGVAWGSIALFHIAEVSIAHQVFLAFVLGGMAAGAASTFATVKYAYAAFSLPSLAPLTLHFFLINDTFHHTMAAMTSLFGFLLWRISLHNFSVNRTSLLLRFENREMMETLRQAKEHVEGLNAQLMAEINARLDAEAGLRAYQEQLEQVVQERTADLRNSNDQLKAEIEERKQYEKALRESQSRLVLAQQKSEAAIMAKTEFLANMSHEMRTPLAGTLGMIKLVLDMEIGAEERQLLEMARRSGDSLLRIIADVLDFSRLEAGMMTFEETQFCISAVVQSALEVVSLNAREKGLHLSWKIDPSVPEQVSGDEGRLRQVLVNLLGNAVKFTERGEIEVSARTFEDPETRGPTGILFSVRDTGTGIPNDQLEKIFGKFTQVDSSMTRRYGGTGLGLALTRQIVEKMGGKIWAESIVAVGSTFYFTLPVR